ncbi:MAG: hypothetical protein M3Y79_11075 [Pseudomonadota bacterium]|nr:hypothetical protein [Pseudomonadota bacterium]
MKKVLKSVNRILGAFGLVLAPARHMMLVYQHDYGSGGYEKYRHTQVLHNKRKIDRIWADSRTMKFIADYLQPRVRQITRGICHGSRRGFEQAEFSALLGCEVIGTEISDTATQFPATVQWDFHEPKPEWVGAFTFGYSNSLDQAFDPRRALDTWVDQLTEDGLLFIEHSMQHSATGASDMDPFGAHPMVMPYLLFEWGRGKYELADILHPPHRKDGKIELWIFVIRKVAAGAS